MNAQGRIAMPEAQRQQAGFTLIEIALCLAIVAFAMTAIMGVLPAGLQVQKSNRDETIINQEGTYFMDAIRTGAMGLNDLTNYVDWIAVTNSAVSPPILATSFNNPTSGVKLYSGLNIIGLLSTPRYLVQSNGRMGTNTVVAKIRAMSGSAAEKSLKNTNFQDIAFSYLLRPEIIPYAAYPTNSILTNLAIGTTEQKIAKTNLFLQAQYLATNLYELRLTFNWPVRPNGSTGPGQQIFRTLVSGHLSPLPDPVYKNQRVTNYFFQANQYF